MKKIYKVLMLMALGLTAGIAAIRAQATYPTGELIVGFTVGSGNDEIYDLGQESGITNGQSWNLAFLLTAYGNYSGLNWGVIGNGPNSGTPRTLWTTTAVGALAGSVRGNSAFSALNNAVGALYNNFTNAGSGQWVTVPANSVSAYSWNEETTPNATLATSYILEYENPNVVGVNSASFSQVLEYTGFSSPPTPAGTFTLAANGVLTFNASIPKFTSAFVSAGQFSLIGTNGEPSTQYRILSSTNLASASWSAVSTGNFSISGGFSYTSEATNPASFFRVVTP